MFISDDGVAQISEQENYIIGLNSALRDFAVQNKASSSSLESYDIYCFGNIKQKMFTSSLFGNLLVSLHFQVICYMKCRQVKLSQDLT